MFQCPCVYGMSKLRAAQLCEIYSSAVRPVILTIRSLPRTDAVPKKRGPKTDVLEALLKRVDGLEAKLKEKKEQPGTPTTEEEPATPVTLSAPTTPTIPPQPSSSVMPAVGDSIEVKPKPAKPPQPIVDTTRIVEVAESAAYTPSPSR